ncbi:MAG: sugar phosphate isomerase/epimerase family protein [Candidatus Rifleibacteriota bacterium]
MDRLEKPVLEKFRTIVEKHNFKPTVHAPFFDLNLGARDNQIRKISFYRMVWAIETAALLKADRVVIHPGYGPMLSDDALESWLKRAEQPLKKLEEIASKANVRIAFENIFDKTPDKLARIIKHLNSETFGICLDIGHFNVFTTENLTKWLEVLGENILEVHLHDNNGKADEHLAFNYGNIDYSQFIEWFENLPPEKKPVLTIEMPHPTHVIQSVNKLRSWLS